MPQTLERRLAIGTDAEIADPAAQTLQEVAQHPAVGVPYLARLQQDPAVLAQFLIQYGSAPWQELSSEDASTTLPETSALCLGPAGTTE